MHRSMQCRKLLFYWCPLKVTIALKGIPKYFAFTDVTVKVNWPSEVIVPERSALKELLALEKPNNFNIIVFCIDGMLNEPSAETLTSFAILEVL